MPIEGMVSLWWPDRGDYAMAIRRDPDIPNRYNLVGTGALVAEPDLNMFGPIRPKKYGYLEVTANQELPVDMREVLRWPHRTAEYRYFKPSDIKLVCLTPVYLGFWEALARNLKHISPVAFTSTKKCDP